MAKRRRRAAAARRLLIIVLLAVCVVALFLYLKNGGAIDTGETAAQVEINEVMTSNKGAVPDETGNFPDWVEFYNNTDAALDISGYGLTDKLISAAKWTFPEGSVIQPRGYLVVFCSGDTTRGSMHTPFKLSASDEVILTTVSGKVVDSITLKPVASGYSLGRSAEDTSAWKEMTPSPGYPNTEEGAALYLATLSATADESIGVYLNEFMASNASTLIGPDGAYCDWIELYNTTGSEIDLTGYGISDSPTQPLKYTLPQGTKIAANGVLLIYCTGRETPEGSDKIEAPFGLASYQESVVFSTPAGRILDQFDYTRAQTDISFARVPDGTGEWSQASQPTPGYQNNSAGLQAFMKTLSYGTGDIVISEVLNANVSTLKQPDGGYYDWVEIHNQTSSPISLAGYALSNNAKNPAKWVFPDITLDAGEYLTVLASGKNVSDAQKKNNLETNFGISSAGDVVFLFQPDGTILDKIQVPKGHADVSYGRSDTSQLFYKEPTPNAANGSGFAGYADAPKILTPGGTFESAQQVSVEVPEGCTVTYTTDGTVPTESSARYNGPITVSKTAPLRVRAFQSGYMGSDVASQTYVIYTGESTIESHKYTLPVVSIVTDPANFWDPATGIYVVGNDFAEVSGQLPTDIRIATGMQDPNWNLANFNAQPKSHPDPLGREWERDVHFDYIDASGVSVYSGDGIIQIQGQFSRNNEQKGLALIARGAYGDSMFNYPFFENRTIQSYKSLILRASAQDATYSRIRDNLVTTLFEEGNNGLPEDRAVVVQAHKQVVVLINGRYWGVYDFMERITEDFVAERFQLSNPDSVDLLYGNGNQFCVLAGNGWEDYTEMVEWAGSHDLGDASNYEYINTLMDTENYATYVAAEIIVGNTDSGNVKYWRSPEKDNKWRWILYDFCWAMNRNDDSSDAYTSGYRRDFFSRYFNPEGHGSSKATSTVLIRALLGNASFRQMFLEKVAIMLNEVYTPEKINAMVDRLQSNIDAEMKYDVDLWNNITYDFWKQHCDNIRGYAEHYQEYALKYVQNYFSLSDSEMTSIFGRVTTLEDTASNGE
ncbi:MAG: lamin tail domain-containing protein [Eubacteriales bacterium]|nr:lamin tail domain-containing protein [Eubacteriales bacterium]